MLNDFKESKQAIREFIGAHWSDQKLSEVWAFNRDGKMSYNDACGCIRGVTLVERLHSWTLECALGGHEHYRRTSILDGVYEAEEAYYRLGFQCADFLDYWDRSLAARRLSAILRAEMKFRERARMAATVPEVEAQLA